MSSDKHANDFSQNAELIKKAQSGDADAMQSAVALNSGLVKSLVVRFLDRGVEYDDLMQIGSLGMIKAIKSYSPDYGTVFSTYAVPLIIGEIRRYLRDDGAVKVSRGVKRLGVHAMKEKERFVKETGREPKMSELAQRCGCTVQETAFALEACCPVRSLSEPLAEKDGACLESVIADEDDTIQSLCDRITLKDAIASLDETEQRIIYLRYYKDLSQQQTARLLGLSQVKISRSEKKIFEKLRKQLLI